MNLRAAWGVLGVSPHMTHLLPLPFQSKAGQEVYSVQITLPLLELHEAQN